MGHTGFIFEVPEISHGSSVSMPQKHLAACVNFKERPSPHCTSPAISCSLAGVLSPAPGLPGFPVFIGVSGFAPVFFRDEKRECVRWYFRPVVPGPHECHCEPRQGEHSQRLYLPPSVPVAGTQGASISDIF